MPDYYVHTEHPMDFSTMRVKISDQKYKTMDDFEADFDLVIKNCLSYNAKDTVFYRAALKMRDQVSGLEQAQVYKHFGKIWWPCCLKVMIK